MVSYDGTSSTATYTILSASSAGWSKTGYTFSKWNTKSNGKGTNYSASSTKTFTSSSKALDLYAQSTANTYTITYKSNLPSGTSTTVATQSVDFGSTFTLSYNPSNLSCTGYSTTGWVHTTKESAGASCSCAGTWNASTASKSFKYGNSYTYSYAGNITVYIKWTPNTYKVTYYLVNEAKGTTTTLYSDSFTYGNSATIRSTSKVSYSGYTTSSVWYTNESCTTTNTNYQSGKTYSSASNLNLYCKITGNQYYVYYYVDGELQSDMTQEFNYGADIIYSGVINSCDKKISRSMTKYDNSATGCDSKIVTNFAIRKTPERLLLQVFLIITS